MNKLLKILFLTITILGTTTSNAVNSSNNGEELRGEVSATENGISNIIKSKVDQKCGDNCEKRFHVGQATYEIKKEKAPDCEGSRIYWGRGANLCTSIITHRNNGEFVHAIDRARNGEAIVTCSEGTWRISQEKCNTKCGSQKVSWGGGKCFANAPMRKEGEVASIISTAKSSFEGTASFKCESGKFNFIGGKCNYKKVGVWDLGNYSECNCMSLKAKRLVYCKNAVGGEVLPDEYCEKNVGPKPPEVKQCDLCDKISFNPKDFYASNTFSHKEIFDKEIGKKVWDAEKSWRGRAYGLHSSDLTQRPKEKRKRFIKSGMALVEFNIKATDPTSLGKRIFTSANCTKNENGWRTTGKTQPLYGDFWFNAEKMFDIKKSNNITKNNSVKITNRGDYYEFTAIGRDPITIFNDFSFNYGKEDIYNIFYKIESNVDTKMQFFYKTKNKNYYNEENSKKITLSKNENKGIIKIKGNLVGKLRFDPIIGNSGTIKVKELIITRGSLKPFYKKFSLLCDWRNDNSVNHFIGIDGFKRGITDLYIDKIEITKLDGELGKSCAEIKYNHPDEKSGIFIIQNGFGEFTKTYCDMDTDDGGWTLVARSEFRKDNSYGCSGHPSNKDFGWFIKTGDINNFDAPYSYSLNNLSWDFNEILFGNRKTKYSNELGNYAYKHSVEPGFLRNWKDEHYVIGSPTPIKKENYNFGMARYIGMSKDTKAYHWRDVDGQGFGLSAIGWATCYSKDGNRGAWGGYIHRDPGVIYVRDFNPKLKRESKGKSCLDIKLNNPDAQSGRYVIEPVKNKFIKTYCDMDTDGGGWTEVESFSMDNNSIYNRAKLTVNMPRNESNYNEKDFRVSKYIMNTLSGDSNKTEWLTYIKNKNKDNYAIIKGTNMTKYTGAGEYLNTRGKVRGYALPSKSKWWNNVHAHLDVKANNLPYAVNSEDIFGYYDNYDRNLISPSTITKWFVREFNPLDRNNIISSSCDEIKIKNKDATSGNYIVNINGEKLKVYCDMETKGGGWTLIESFKNDYPNDKFNKNFNTPITANNGKDRPIYYSNKISFEDYRLPQKIIEKIYDKSGEVLASTKNQLLYMEGLDLESPQQELNGELKVGDYSFKGSIKLYGDNSHPHIKSSDYNIPNISKDESANMFGNYKNNIKTLNDKGDITKWYVRRISPQDFKVDGGSCSEIYALDSSSQSGAYNLMYDGYPYKAYCDFSHNEPRELVMIIPATDKRFQYASDIWTSDSFFGKPELNMEGYKSPAYSRIKFKKEIAEFPDIGHEMVEKENVTFLDFFNDTSLVEKPSMDQFYSEWSYQNGYKMYGTNRNCSSQNGKAARWGFDFNNEKICSSNDAVAGIGIGYKNSIMDSIPSSGSFSTCCSENPGKKYNNVIIWGVR